MDAIANPLTRHERRFLWMLSQGVTLHGIAATFGVSEPTARITGLQIRRKMDTTTNTHSVARAVLDGLIGPREDCGTRYGYVWHRNHDEDACTACRRAHREWSERQSVYGFTGMRVGFEPDEVRLVQALGHGLTIVQVAEQWAVDREVAVRLTASLFRKLDVAHLPVRFRREEALLEARRRRLLNVDPSCMPLDVQHVPRRASGPRPLTETEVRILMSVSSGASLSETGCLLSMPRTSVAARLNGIFKKLDVVHIPRPERRAAALRAYQAQNMAGSLKLG